jgi:hypothetical protein
MPTWLIQAIVRLGSSILGMGLNMSQGTVP